MKKFVCLGLLLASSLRILAFPWSTHKTEAEKLIEIVEKIEFAAAHEVDMARVHKLDPQQVRQMENLKESLGRHLFSKSSITDDSTERALNYFAVGLKDEPIRLLGQIITLRVGEKASKAEVRRLQSEIDKFLKNLPGEKTNRERESANKMWDDLEQNSLA